jgi:predicted DsbA family dithiol-disulfide isomerase
VTTATQLTVDVYADVVCPWCYIGERRLARAIAARPEVAVERHWQPFQLNPNLPPRGIPWADFVRQKFGDQARARGMFDHVAATGAADGLTFDFGRVASAPNTVDAHRLILFAGERGRQWPVAEALFDAYFARGVDLNDREQLAAAAAGAGLDPAEVRARLATDDGVVEVQASQREARRLGVRGVPFFVFDNRIAISGAQPIDWFVRAIDAAVEQQ